MSREDSLDDGPSPLIAQLRNALLDIQSHPCPEVVNPPQTKKRASVALIIRIQPRYTHWPPKDPQSDGDNGNSIEDKLVNFFSQEWVQYGTPEVLFIKRAARKGDKWTGHIALPGGKRDPEDTSDLDAAVRESSEEVGVDLTPSNSINVGNLPQRVVLTSWGKIPLMVLAPFIFLVTTPSLPPLRLQPTEVASAHWVPLPALLSPSTRTFEYQDISNRLAKIEGVWRTLVRHVLGRMIFAAVRLIPSESNYCSSIPGFLPSQPHPSPTFSSTIYGSVASTAASLWPSNTIHPTHPQSSSVDQPLLLWGLTLGVLADFLDLLPPHNAVRLWTYPSFTAWDVRFVLWLISYRFRARKQREFGHMEGKMPMHIQQAEDTMTIASIPSNNLTDGVTGLGRLGTDTPERVIRSQTTPQPEKTEYQKELDRQDGKSPASEEGRQPEVGIAGLGSGYDRRAQDAKGTRFSAMLNLLDGYYALVRRAVVITMVGRGVTILTIIAWLVARRRTRALRNA